DGRFSLYGENFRVNGAACGSGAACALIDGFFAGETAGQIGVSYLISNTNDGNISGVAGLQLDGTAGTPATPTNRNGYSLAIADSVNGSFFQGGLIDSYYDSSQTNNYDAAGGLLTSSSQSFGVLDRNTAQTDNVGRNGNLDWGRWYGDDAQITGVNEGGNLTLGTNQSLHYITGPMSSSEALHNIVNLHGQGAQATYTLAGGTTASSTDGRTGTLTGQLTVSFDYSSSSMSADLGLNMSSGNSYTLTGSGISISNFQPVFAASSEAQNPSLGCMSSGFSTSCSANISGFFSGAQAQQIGLAYDVFDNSTGSVTNGAAAFNQGTITPGAGGGQGI
ncbi:MAG: hypothetical protein Q8J78_05495, partial [Moraxellaceae bacterium]|nr:hypothetical protein [Moraxellaceae bacterium]